MGSQRISYIPQQSLVPLVHWTCMCLRAQQLAGKKITKPTLHKHLIEHTQGTSYLGIYTLMKELAVLITIQFQTWTVPAPPEGVALLGYHYLCAYTCCAVFFHSIGTIPMVHLVFKQITNLLQVWHTPDHDQHWSRPDTGPTKCYSNRPLTS